MNKKKDIFVGEITLLPLEDVKEKVYLNEKGEIYSKKLRIKDDRHRNFMRMYFFSKDYLDSKKRTYTIERFFKIDLHDIREMLWRKKQKTISRNVIEDIVHSKNQIARIREVVKNRFRKYVLKAYDKKLDEEQTNKH